MQFLIGLQRSCDDMNGKEIIYDAVISLGNSCIPAHHIQANCLSTSTFPFDWLCIPSIKMVHELMENNFNSFMKFENLTPLDPQPGDAYYQMQVHDTATDITFVHDYPRADDTLSIRYEYIIEKYKQRIWWLNEVFKKGGRCLFIRDRNHHDDDKPEDYADFVKFIKGYNPSNDVWTTQILKTEELVCEDLPEGVVNWVISNKDDILRGMNWMGNHAHWNKMFSNIYLRSTMRMKKYLESNVNKMIDFARKSGKPVVFWGNGSGQRLLPYFINGGIVPQIYNENGSMEYNVAYTQVTAAGEMMDKSRFVAVTASVWSGWHDVMQTLRESDLTEGKDYAAMPEGMDYIMSMGNL